MTSTRPDRPRLHRLFDPTSIAVVGASASPVKLGSVMLDAIARSSGDTRTVFGINAKATDGSFLPSLRAATEVHGHALDLAVLCVPAAATADAVRDAAECGVGATEKPYKRNSPRSAPPPVFGCSDRTPLVSSGLTA
jgi:acyl-CoA synthetase (NDP forming)